MIELFAFLDCETSGLRKPNMEAEATTQPHMLQLACRLVTADRRFVGGFSRIIKPEGWTIEPEAEAVHGISEALASQVGVPAWCALAELEVSLREATKIVGFNLRGFDEPVIDLAILRANGEGRWWRRSRPKMVDLMEVLTPAMKLPGQFGEYKFPTLDEAIEWSGGLRILNQPHDAWNDAAYTEGVFWQARERGLA